MTTNEMSHPLSVPAVPVMSRVLVQAVQCDWQTAYAFTVNPERMTEWASGLANGRIQPDQAIPGDWLIDSPTGHARLRLARRNDFGVLDHWVTPEGVTEVYVPFRVIATGAQQCEFQLTLLRQPGMDDAAFERDSDWIQRDLRSPQRLLEAR